MQDLISDLIKVALPAGFVLYAFYLTIKAFLNKQLIEQQQNAQGEALKQVLPLRLQAYERLTLLLERISPNSLLIRNAGQAITAVELQQLLLAEIRQEFQHNVAQQIYISHENWERLRLTVQEVTSLINRSASEVPAEAPALDLARKISELSVGRPMEVWQETLNAIKQEAQKIWQ
ncbi:MULTISPECIES: hypothetical protein [unclassified Siphonobacter]|uniref:DUF7935 family protein n=1 Tax=unclassified Siphonobacter TaxID=2635712 RepID=UPI00278786BF|nr:MULTISPECIES: hypothetical protein [unclassified Siphonobacter]MDQ1089428.1 hypothetical protein [Siphonobacter sp. SORGH_AS_1065]MDR6195604.1 hypothetical protein [Siphonobacter sp. SORGH_AS_0500]